MAIKQVTTLTRPNNTIPWHDPNFSDPNYPVNAVGVFLADGRILSEHVEETDNTRVNTFVFKDADAICDWWFNRMVDADAKAAYSNLTNWQVQHFITQTITRDFNYTP